MSTILYYSTFCENCKKVLSIIAQSSIKDDMHFLCIDNRYKHNNGAIYIKLQNGEEVILPPKITKVPALLLINRGYHVLFGDEIMKHVQPSIDVVKQNAVVQTGEPASFSLGISSYGVASDHYSYLDQSSEDLSAKGNGGLRQTHHYASIDYTDQIETPPDTYSADTIGNVSMEKLQSQRDTEVNRK